MSSESFGASLKRARELRGISLQEVAEATRIHPKYIDAIEREHFEQLPGLTFLKGYVRAYADYVGLSTDEVLLQLEPLILPGTPQENRPASTKKRIYSLALGIPLLALGLFLFVRGCVG